MLWHSTCSLHHNGGIEKRGLVRRQMPLHFTPLFLFDFFDVLISRTGSKLTEPRTGVNSTPQEAGGRSSEAGSDASGLTTLSDQ